MLLPVSGLGMNSAMDDMNLIQQRHHLVVRELGEEIDLEIGAGDDDPSFANATLISGPPQHEPSTEENDEGKQMQMGAPLQSEDHHDLSKTPPTKKKKKVVKRWREEWADTYKWAYVDVKDGTARIFCSVCREYGRKHRRNPYGNEGSRNMQMSALEEHNNSLLHKEAVRLQMASKDKIVVEKPVYVKGAQHLAQEGFFLRKKAAMVVPHVIFWSISREKNKRIFDRVETPVQHQFIKATFGIVLN